MIEVQVPKDISQYDPPFVGPLTARQTVCVVAAAAVEYVYYIVLKTLGIPITLTDGGNLPILIGIVLALPILYLAIGKPYGMRPEIYLYYYLLPWLLAPKDRPYATKLTYETLREIADAQAEEEAGQKQPGKKQTIKRKEKKKPPANKKAVKAQRRRDTIYA